MAITRLNTNQVPPSSGGGGHTIQDDGIALTQRTGLNFKGAIKATDDSPNNRTNVELIASTGWGLHRCGSEAVVVGPAVDIDFSSPLADTDYEVWCWIVDSLGAMYFVDIPNSSKATDKFTTPAIDIAGTLRYIVVPHDNTTYTSTRAGSESITTSGLTVTFDAVFIDSSYILWAWVIGTSGSIFFLDIPQSALDVDGFTVAESPENGTLHYIALHL